MSDVRLGHVNPEYRKFWPDLFERVDKSSCPTPDIDNLQLALVLAGKDLMKLWQRLPPNRICRAVKKNLDLRVIQFGGLLRHPATRLIVEVLEVVARAPPRGNFVSNFAIGASLAASMDVGKIVEENS